MRDARSSCANPHRSFVGALDAYLPPMDGADTSYRWISPAVIQAPGKILAVLVARPGLVAGSPLSFVGARRAPPQHRSSVLASVLVDAAKHLGLVQAPRVAGGGAGGATRASSLWAHDTEERTCWSTTAGWSHVSPVRPPATGTPLRQAM